MSSRGLERFDRGTVGQMPKYLPCDVPLEAANDLGLGFPSASLRLTHATVGWCHRIRTMTTLGYVSPAEFEKAYHDRLAAPVGMAVLT